MNDDLKIVVSGSAWMGGGIGSIDSALHQLLTDAADEVLIVAYAVSSAASDLFMLLERVLQRGVRIRMVVNRFAKQHEAVQYHLQRLQRNYAHVLDVWSFEPGVEGADLHAKLIVVDRQRAFVGSANLSLRGLFNNHELGMVVSGQTAEELGRVIDRLLQSPMVKVIN